MSFLQKRLLLLFLIANMTAEYILLMPASKFLFFGVLGLSVCFLLQRFLYTKAIAMCPHIYVLAAILILYQLLFGYQSTSQESLIYFVGKLASFAIILLSVGTDFGFYLRKSILPLSYVILALVILGWFVHRTSSIAENYYLFGFANRNAACTLSAIGFAGFLFAKDNHSKIDYLWMSILLVTVLVGGSRSALAMCVIFIFVRYGLSMRLIAVILTLAVLIIFVLPELGIRVTAFERLLGTISGEVSLDRATQHQGAMVMIQERPWTGWGLASQMQGKALSITQLGAHNGYLTLIMYMGLPLGITFIAVIIHGVIKRLKLLRLKDNALNYHIAVILCILFGAYQEDYLVGVNQISTNLFFVSFVVTGFYSYYLKHVRISAMKNDTRLPNYMKRM